MNLLSSFLLSLVLHSAQATIPPPNFILSEVLKGHEGIKNIAMEGKVTDLRTKDVFKEIVKVDFQSGRVSTSYLSVTDQVLGGQETQLKDLHPLGKFWLDVALDPNGSRFKQALQDLGVYPHEQIEAKLSRFGTQVTWAWGKDTEIQFLKDEFLAFDYRSGGNGPNSQEILLKDHVSAAIRIPRNVFVKLQGKETFHFELKGVKTNLPLKSTGPVTPVSQPSVKEWALLVR